LTSGGVLEGKQGVGGGHGFDVGWSAVVGTTSKAKLFFIKKLFEKDFLKSLTNFNLTPFGPQNRRILCLCQTEILGQV
jgi:hypothetical protein